MHFKRVCSVLLAFFFPFVIGLVFLSPIAAGQKAIPALQVKVKNVKIASGEAETSSSTVQDIGSLNNPIVDTSINTIEPGSQVSETLSEDVGHLQFVENVGQFDDQVRFLVRGAPGTIHFTDDAVWFTFWADRDEDSARCLNPSFVADDSKSCSEESEREGVVLKWSFEGANPTPNIVAFGPQDITLSYFLGNDPVHWAANVPVYSGIRYRLTIFFPGIVALRVW